MGSSKCSSYSKPNSSYSAVCGLLPESLKCHPVAESAASVMQGTYDMVNLHWLDVCLHAVRTWQLVDLMCGIGGHSKVKPEQQK
jgi:hypothetical protein